MLVKKGVKVRRYVGNEYAQIVGIQGYGGELVWVGNVYLPPATNIQTRGIDDEVARNDIEDIFGNIPPHARSVLCGDWNTRVGSLHPKISDTEIKRISDDDIVSPRAQWIINMCELNGWYILNGI